MHSTVSVPVPASADGTTVFGLVEAHRRGAVVVDVRPQAQRVAEGTLPGALAIELDLLEARLDPAGGSQLALAVDHDVEWVIVCSDGSAARRAATALRLRGLRRATGLVGGYRAIKAARLLGALMGERHCTRELTAVSAH